MTCKVIFFFENKKQGWSETYYNDATAVSVGFDNSRILFQQRSLLLADPSALFAVRVSLEGSPRLSILQEVGPGTPYPISTGTYVSGSDIPQAAALAKLYNNTTPVSRSLYLAGNPDNLFDLAAPVNPDANQWNNQFQNYFKPILENGHWQIKKKAFTNTNPPGTKIVAASNVPDKRQMTIQPETPLLVSTGDRVTIYKLKGAAPPPGLVRVVNVVAGPPQVLTVNYFAPPDFVYTDGAFVRLYAPEYPTIQQCTFARITSRKRGRPFGASAGRARSRPR